MIGFAVYLLSRGGSTKLLVSWESRPLVDDAISRGQHSDPGNSGGTGLASLLCSSKTRKGIARVRVW